MHTLLRTSRSARRTLISVTAISATLLAGTATSVAAVPAEKTKAAAAEQTTAAASAVAAPAERLIVGYKSGASEAKSNKDAAEDAEAKGKDAGENLDFQRRLGTGAALVGGKGTKVVASYESLQTVNERCEPRVRGARPVAANVLGANRERYRPYRHEVTPRIDMYVGKHEPAERRLNSDAKPLSEHRACWTR